MGETESWGALWVLVALAMTLAASWVSVIGGRRCWGEAEGWRRECCFNSILKKTDVFLSRCWLRRRTRGEGTRFEIVNREPEN